MINRLFIAGVRFYQRRISPGLPKRCRYHPTCSQYMVDALTYHGPLKGLIMGISRILRCQPLVKGGIDYVPLTFSLKRNPDQCYPGPYQKNKEDNHDCHH
ncbi:membrane protein insertion efficiency factor YidD [Vagococcus humatus]|uniref:membrane protein insertion efficiency factor YidD n=1 Tax=Vagococcus humatus TaxID=1889241 RepID=UPI001A9D2BAA|nr:membrane protein insertion efficiency factor YidD [Vagococcus humatus]